LIPGVVYVVLYTSAFWLSSVVFLVSLLALREFNNVILKERDPVGGVLGVSAGVLVVPLFYLKGPVVVVPYLTGVLAVLFASRFYSGRDLSEAMGWVAARLAGVVYIAVPLAHLIVLRQVESGPQWILFFFTVIWLSDTFAFVVGNAAGRRKLCPSVSPNKTVEGALGGLAGGAAGALVYSKYVYLGASAAEVVTLAVIIGVLGVLGDLVESVMKRGAGVKDSGALIPGHGGVLDRIDSMLFAAPVLYYYLVWT
jgi:phosphatidate cytidylyltransferase